MKEQSNEISSSNEETTKESVMSTSSNRAMEISKTSTPPKPSPAAAVAQFQLDSDDEDTFKRSSRTLQRSCIKSHKYDEQAQQKSRLRRERAQLYTIQESKRRRREEAHRSKKTLEGETPLLQKVKRLKKERKVIELEYGKNDGSMKKRKKNKKKRSSGFTLPK